MTWDRELQEFAREIHSEVLDRATGGLGEGTGADFKVNAFTEMYLDYLAESGAADGGQVCYFEKSLASGKRPMHINGYHFPEDDDRIDIFYTDYRGHDGQAIEGIVTADIEAALNDAVLFLRFARDGSLAGLEESSEAYDMLADIRGRTHEIRRLRVFLLTDKAASSQTKMQQAITSKLRAQQKKNPHGLAMRLELVDLTRVFRLARRGAERDPITVDVADMVAGGLPCIEAPRPNEAYACFLAALPGEMLFELYEEYGQRLLQLNVRSFLQVTGSKSVNAKIRQTLLTEPSMFLPYNNGISATAEHVEIGRNSEGTPVIRAIQGIQIVNGGQTMASIHRARKIDKADISDVFVQAKISVVVNKREMEFDELVGKISVFSNSQNKVNLADFSANDPFHVELEKLAREIWAPGEQSQWFYERARGSYKVMRARLAPTPAKKREFELRLPPSQVFTKTDMAKYLGAWERLPHIVGRGSQKNFVEYMAVLKEATPKKWTPDAVFFRHLVSKAILYKRLETMVREEGFPAYRANVVAYTIALLSDRGGDSFNLDHVWTTQSASPALTETLRAWTHHVYDAIIDSAAGRNVTEWCKREDCWKVVCGLELDLDGGLPELGAKTTSRGDDGDDESGRPSVEDLSLVGAIMEVPEEAWTLMAQWGSGSGALTSSQIKMCYTMARKASGGWESAPTVGQAKQSLIILRTAKHKSSVLDQFEWGSG